MPPPSKQKGPGGSANSHQDQNTQMGDYDSPKGNRKRGPRHVPGQTALPAFVPAEVLIPSPGRTRVALIVRDCPRCEGVHLHVCSSPAPKVLSRRAGCGQRYDLYPFKAARRGRRAA
ncbi:hypothetical protein [Streptosporangium sp. NPDC004631]